jgi:phosphoribosyl-ATP pyrophosphohydrolase
MSSNDSLDRLAEVLQSRKNGDPETSYVARLLHKGPDAFLKKIGEEATEMVMACKDASSGGNTAALQEKVVAEAADLWFHSLVALSYYGLAPKDVIAELERRVGMSGLEEKASRKASLREHEEQSSKTAR